MTSTTTHGRVLGAGLALTAAMLAGPVAAQSIDALPADLKALYTDNIPVGPSAYDDFKMPAKPWKWCHSESYMGNPWRVSMTNELKRLVDGAIAKGDAVSFELSDSNGDVPQQIAQIRAFIDKGCSIITTIAGSSTGLNDVIEAAYKAGIPVVTTASAVTSPYALNIQHNHNVWGYKMGKGIAAELGGTGNVLMVEGIPGSPIVDFENSGGYRAFAEDPGPHHPGQGQRQLDRQRHQERRPADPGHQPGADRCRLDHRQRDPGDRRGVRRGRPAPAADHGLDVRRRARLLEGPQGFVPLLRRGDPAVGGGAERVPRRRAPARRPAADRQHAAGPGAGDPPGGPRTSGPRPA